MAISETAKLIAQLILDDSKFTGKVNSASTSVSRLDKITAQAGRGAANFGRNFAVAGGVVLGALGTQVVAGVKSLEDLESVLNATEGVIKSTGGTAGVSAKQVRDYAEALEATTTADDKAIQKGENLLLTFTNIGEDVFPGATKAVVDLGIAMAEGDVANADFKSSAIQIGKALNDPIKGITALTRVGVSFTDQQKKQIEALQKAGDTEGAQKIILAELEKEFGKAGEAAGTGFGADMRRVQDAVEGAQQALARGFLPLIQRVARALNEKLSDPKNIARIEELGNSLADGFDKLLGIITKIPWDSVGQALQLGGMGAKAILDAFVALPPWVQTAVLTGWGLNKLTGGALTGIAGELAKGLIHGVLGINAGVVNINAATVNGGGGVPGVAGAAGAAGGGGLVAAASVGLTAASILAIGFAVGTAIETAAGGANNGMGHEVNVAGIPVIIGLSQRQAALMASGNEAQKANAGVVKHSIDLQTASNAAAAVHTNERQEAIRASIAAANASRIADSASERALISQASAGTITALHGDSASERATIAAASAAQTQAQQNTAAAARAAGQQSAAAIRDKDLSVTVNTHTTVSTFVSVANDLNAKNNYKSVYRVAE